MVPAVSALWYVFCYVTPPLSGAAATVGSVPFVTHFVLILRRWFGPALLGAGDASKAQIPDFRRSGPEDQDQRIKAPSWPYRVKASTFPLVTGEAYMVTIRTAAPVCLLIVR